MDINWDEITDSVKELSLENQEVIGKVVVGELITSNKIFLT